MDNNNNNKAKKINEIRLPATEKESKNETGQKSLNKFPANDNTDKLLSRVLYSTKNKPAQRYNLPTSRKRPFSNKQRRPGSASRKRIHHVPLFRCHLKTLHPRSQIIIG